MTSIKVTISALLLLLLGGCGGKTETVVVLKPFDFTYPVYAQILATYVQNGRVNYTMLKANRTGLDTVIERIAAADLSRASQEQRLAFYINAYNALTLRSIVDAYPVNSIKEIDGVWTDRKWLVAGENMTLNHLEHDVLRKEFSEPRTHIAINCASLGCPPLPSRPYFPDSLEQQLDAASRDFSQSIRYNRLIPDTGTAELSSIFDWFGEDFIPDYFREGRYPELSRKENAAVSFVIEHHPEPVRAELESVPFAKVTNIDYDWSLNDAR